MTNMTNQSCPFGCPLQAQEEVPDSLSPLSPAIAVIRSVPREKRGEFGGPLNLLINDGDALED